MDVKKWVINWFENNTEINLNEIKNNLNENYLLKGWIDSFQFISLISDIEEKLNVFFLNDDFQDRIFSTINGLIEKIKERIK